MEIPRWLERTALLIGPEAIEKLRQARILVVGLGGVGSYAGEFLVRGGIGTIHIIDGDTVDITNINRQMQAVHSTIGMSKAQLLKERFEDINPEINLTFHETFLEPDKMETLIRAYDFDFILDCIDSVSPKLSLIKTALSVDTHLISAMGAGGKTDPSKIRVGDIWETNSCKFARMLRKRLKREDIRQNFIAVYSEEVQPRSALEFTDGRNYKKSYYGTISYMPALFGLTMASEAIRQIIR